MSKALPQAEIELEVPFQDLDPMQVVWHGNYFRYFEAARAKLLRMIGYDYPEMSASGYSWPIIDTRVRFVQALQYRQKVRVQAEMVEWENRLKIDYLISDLESGKRLTTGYTIQCAIDMRSMELQLVTPEVFRQRLKDYI